MRRVTPPLAFEAFCSGLHQDVGDMVDSLEGLADYCLDFVRPDQRAELRAFVVGMLATRTDAELKGVLNRAMGQHFVTRGARAFLETIRDRIDAQARP